MSSSEALNARAPTRAVRGLRAGGPRVKRRLIAVSAPKPLRPFVGRSSGFSMIELVVSIAVIGIAMGAVASALSFGLSHQSDGMVQARTVALAEAYMEEILAKRYDENTPVGGVPACTSTGTACSASNAFDDGESRGQFDDVDDYDGLTESPPRDPLGAQRTGYENWSVSVTVAYPSAAQVTALGLAAETDAKLVQLQVTTPGGETMQFAAVRANF